MEWYGLDFCFEDWNKSMDGVLAGDSNKGISEV